jgi:hypothetical protein
MMNGSIQETVLHLVGGGIGGEIVTILPVVFGADWPRTEPSTAIRANIFQEGLNAGLAKCAFERANHRERRIWWQGDVAILASGSQFQHGSQCESIISAFP